MNLVGTTKPTIQAVIRDRTHPNAASLSPRNPAEVGLCTYQELEKASRKGMKAQGRDPDAEAAARAKYAAEDEAKAAEEKSLHFSNFLKSTGRSS